MSDQRHRSHRDSHISEIKGRTVYLGLRDNVNTAYKKLHRMLKEEGILDRLRELEFFTKKSTRQRTAKSRGMAREMKRQAREALSGGIRREDKRTGNKGKRSNKKLLLRQMMKDIKDAEISGKRAKKGRRKPREDRSSVQTD